MKILNSEYGMRNKNRSDEECGQLIAVMVPVLTMLFFLMERML